MEAERRQVTVLFADVVGFTSFSERSGGKRPTRLCEGDDPRAVLIRHHFIFALLWNARYSDAVAVQRATAPMASRLGDDRSRAYSFAGEVYVSTIADAPKPVSEYEATKRELIAAASNTEGVYIQCWARFVIVWEEIYRGRMNEARSAAQELMEVGRRLNDPRTTGFGLAALSWIALTSDSYEEAVKFCDQSLMLTLAPFERDNAVRARGWALILLRQADEAVKQLEEDRSRCIADGNIFALKASGAIFGVREVLRGNIGAGIGLIEDAIATQESDGCRLMADYFRVFVSEVYLQIIGGQERLSLYCFVEKSADYSESGCDFVIIHSALDVSGAGGPAYRPRRNSYWSRANDSWSSVQKQKEAGTCTPAPDRSKANTLAIRADSNSRASKRRLRNWENSLNPMIPRPQPHCTPPGAA